MKWLNLINPRSFSLQQFTNALLALSFSIGVTLCWPVEMFTLKHTVHLHMCALKLWTCAEIRPPPLTQALSSTSALLSHICCMELPQNTAVTRAPSVPHPSESTVHHPPQRFPLQLCADANTNPLLLNGILIWKNLYCLSVCVDVGCSCFFLCRFPEQRYMHTGSPFKTDGYVVFSSLNTAAVGQREIQHFKSDLHTHKGKPS